MVYGLGSDSDSDLTDLPPSPPSSPKSRSQLALSRHGSPTRLSSPPFKSHKPPLRPKRQPSVSQPHPPSSPKRRKRVPPPPVQQPDMAKRVFSRRGTKRPIFAQGDDSSDESQDEREIVKPKRRRKSHVASRAPETSQGTVKPQPKRVRPQAMPPRSATPPPRREQPMKKMLPLELRPASFLAPKGTSFLTKALPIQPANGGAKPQPRADTWSYTDLNGLAWVRLDIQTGGISEQIQPASTEVDRGGCWWPAEITQNTLNELKLALCNLKTTLELTPPILDESNILTFRRPNSSSVRFPTFKASYTPCSTSTAESPLNPDTLQTTTVLATANGNLVLPTDPATLETTWKAALTRAFEIDTESNDGLEDIFLLFSQKSKSPRDEDGSTLASGDTALDLEEDEGEKTDEGDVLENGTVVLCRYRTRYYPAKIVSYLPREGKRRYGRYQCSFADDSTRIAGRQEIMTTLDEGFVTCSLGSYERYVAHDHSSRPTQSRSCTTLRAPTPDPRASPSPECSTTQIDPSKYCALERMRDQLKPILPFLQGIIERTYAPAQGRQRQGENVLDRHAVFMQGGRARKNLAFSVYTGDLNEDDCEELMFEVSRWALRGERWARAEVQDQDGDDQLRKDEEGVEAKGGDQSGGNRTDTPNGSEKEHPKEIDGDPPQAELNGQRVDVNDVEAIGGNSSIDKGEEEKATADATSGDSTEIEGEPEAKQVIAPATTSGTQLGAFHRLIQLQPPRPTGAADYEALTPEERMGYVSDVLYPEAAALLLSYRRGIRTQPGPLADPEAEYGLYLAGLEAAKNTASKEDWVDQILAIRQLRQNAKRHGASEEPAQVIVSGGTRSRPKYMPSKTSSMLK